MVRVVIWRLTSTFWYWWPANDRTWLARITRFLFLMELLRTFFDYLFMARMYIFELLKCTKQPYFRDAKRLRKPPTCPCQADIFFMAAGWHEIAHTYTLVCLFLFLVCSILFLNFLPFRNSLHRQQCPLWHNPTRTWESDKFNDPRHRQ